MPMQGTGLSMNTVVPNANLAWCSQPSPVPRAICDPSLMEAITIWVAGLNDRTHFAARRVVGSRNLLLLLSALVQHNGEKLLINK